MAKQRTEITIETDRVIIRGWGTAAGWCERCVAAAPMVTPEHAAKLSGATPRSIYRQIENGELHFTETARGVLLVCRNSLSTKA